MRKNFIAGILAGSILAAVLLFGQPPRQQEQFQEQSPVLGEAEEAQVTLIVQTGDGEVQYELSDVVGKTALEATIQATGGEVVAEGEGEMAFVTSINGRQADPAKRESWELVINGEPSKVGAGSYVVQAGDSILWRISTYSQN